MNVGMMAQIACLLEVTARKPGNVHRLIDFPGDAHYLDFLLSAAAIADPMNQSRDAGVGQTVLSSVEATRQVVKTNTNLGIILLLAPLTCVPDSVPLLEGIREILYRLTVEDTHLVYQAIRAAQPGGLGKVADEDISDEPSVTLLDAMRLAADRDGVARQYATGFQDIFEIVVPALSKANDLEASIIHAFLTMLAARPDSLIARKRGSKVAEEASRRAADALVSGDLAGLDAWLRADGHARNPGATADLIAAGLFVALRDGTIKLPRNVGSWERPIQ